ncbi:DUF2884 family protein [Colwellia sp. 1_MG-2023]|uniref:DUF2884 family protein n=1 Tax=Colwellia sp. 1_MG-2023 TaxID=3062649 RepID=UPI0026E11F35|nr:DUF2884 family protein [Colwellia sp. 1_MG-2023]MDO6445838.1 DUF2884 family protein [Colwellia sp. 1_MG-2023]
MLLRNLVLIASSFCVHNALAEQCDINLKYGVIIDPSHVRIIEHGKTYIQVNGNHQLFINGSEIPLSDEQKQLVSEYFSGIREQIPEIVSIAIESVDVGLKVVNKVIAGITGENSASHQKLQKQFDELQWRIRTRFNHSDNSFYIAPQDFDNFDDVLAGEFEEEIEAIITDSIGTIVSTVGNAISSHDIESSEQRPNTLVRNMGNISKDLKLNSKISTIESKVSVFCQQLKNLNTIEQKLNENIIKLKSFNLIDKN